MRKKPLVLLLAVLGGCSSPPKAILPDGSDRVPINHYTTGAAINKPTPAQSDIELALQREHAAVERERAAVTQEKISYDAFNTQLAVLNKRIADLQSQIEKLQSSVSNEAAAKSDNAAVKASSGDSSDTSKSSKAEATKEVPSSSAKDVTFRVQEEFGKSEFKPNTDEEQAIISAARDAKLIHIRGRTDSEISDAANRKIALERALNARAFLIKNGVSGDKMKVYYKSAGAFIADNSTPEGKALNRRVEIHISKVQKDRA
ncbi:MAG TPA: OmpA family protein [Methylobacter sp.]